MPSRSKTATDISSDKSSQERMDSIVSAAFDELYVEITSKTELHPAEQLDRDGSLQEHRFPKIYDLINSYHAFCRLCEQHFYSRSLANDINSFFQKHINTSYHKQMRALCLPPNDVPIFTWEEKFCSGKCHVCDMSGLNAYVLDTKFSPLKLMKLHFCVWDQENRENNEKFLRKLNLLKKFCGLTIFRNVCIKTVNGRDVCLLCGMSLPWSGEKASCHLLSDRHYQKFCMLLKRYLSFAPKDALNGFNLESITRWLINYDPPVLKEFADYDERGTCFKESNIDENPYPEEESNYSYSPKSLEECIDAIIIAFFGVSKSKALFPSEQPIFDLNEEFFADRFFRKQKKLVQIIKNYRNLKLELEKPCEPPPSKKKVKLAEQATASEVNDLKKYFLKKLNWVSAKFMVANEEEMFCQVCDMYVFKKQKDAHLKGSCHKSQEMKWEQLKVYFANERFMDPFRKTKSVYVCLICGMVFNTSASIAHLKGEMHLRKFAWYCSINSRNPISSEIVVRADFYSYCAVCKRILNKKKSLSSLKKALKNIRLHWPCLKLEEKKAKPTEKSEAINEERKKSVEKSLNAVQDIACSTLDSTSQKSEMKSDEMSCSKDEIDFKKVEKTMEDIVNVFEGKIINNVIYKSAYLIYGLDDSKSPLTTIKEKMKERQEEMKEMEMERQPTACGHDQPRCPPAQVERKEEVDEKCEKIVKNETGILKMENNVTKAEDKESTSKKEEIGKESKSEEKKKEEFVSKNEKKEESANVKEENTKEKKKEESANVKEENTKEKKKEESANVKEENTKEKKKRESMSKKQLKKKSKSDEKKKEEFIRKEEKKGETANEEEIKAKTPNEEEEKKEETKTKKEKNRNEDSHEVLIIEGLPIDKKKVRAIYSKFSAFGKIHYCYFKEDTVIMAYVKPGIAEAVAKGPDIIFDDRKLSFTVTTRENIAKTERKPFSLNQDLINLLQDPSKLMDFALNLIVQAAAALNSPVERRREELVCSTIISAVLECFPNGRCYPFGSRLSGLMLNNSDLDVFFDCGGMYEGFQKTTSSSQKRLVNKVASLLRKKREVTEIVVIDRARVPIVSFLHEPTLMRCDLSFKNGLSIQNTLLIKFVSKCHALWQKFMLSLDWRVRPLILFLKYWTKVNGLHGPPYFSSYAIAMLVIYYLEQLERPVLPTVEYLQNTYVGRRATIGGWDCSINVNTSSLPKTYNKDPLPQLLLGLFEFYAGFDYSENIISPLNGKPLPRKLFSGPGFPELPMCYKRHILNIPTPIENLVSKNILICVMDPFDLSHILTKSFTSRGLEMFVNFCQASSKHLKNGLPSET